MSDQDKSIDIKKKVEQIYENFGLDIEDMETDEIDRIVDYYDQNRSDLIKDYKNSLNVKKALLQLE
jgi:hypothetical protein